MIRKIVIQSPTIKTVCHNPIEQIGAFQYRIDCRPRTATRSNGTNLPALQMFSKCDCLQGFIMPHIR